MITERSLIRQHTNVNHRMFLGFCINTNAACESALNMTSRKHTSVNKILSRYYEIWVSWKSKILGNIWGTRNLYDPTRSVASNFGSWWKEFRDFRPIVLVNISRFWNHVSRMLPIFPYQPLTFMTISRHYFESSLFRIWIF